MGALTTLGDLAEDANVVEDYPAFAEAVERSRQPADSQHGNLGGNLCQRPRCWYFRNGLGLLPKDESGKDSVTGGENRYHAILGNDGPCEIRQPIDHRSGADCVRRKDYAWLVRKASASCRWRKFFVIPKSESEREHDLKPNEIVTEVVLPPTAGLKVAHYEVRQKDAFDWPLAVAAVALKMDGGTAQSGAAW